MPATSALDHRHSSEAELLTGLRAGEPLALAETYHRTVASVHAVARRLLGSARDVEELLTAVYTELWNHPPAGSPLEGWLRARCFAHGSAELRSRGSAPAAASLAVLLPDLPRPPAPTEPVEQELAGLSEGDRQAVAMAFDQGQASLDQERAGAPAALDRALRTLAGPEPSNDQANETGPSPCRDVEGLADWTLGLLDPERAETTGAAVAERADCHARARRLRRGRRRLEGLPPPPDMGLRILARVLAGAASAPSSGATAERYPHADAELAGTRPGGEFMASVLEDEGTAHPRPAVQEGDDGPPQYGSDFSVTGDPGSYLDPVEPLNGEGAAWAEPGPAAEEREPATAIPSAAESSQTVSGRRRIARRVVGTLVVLLVLAVGAAVGLGIGLLIVSGL